MLSCRPCKGEVGSWCPMLHRLLQEEKEPLDSSLPADAGLTSFLPVASPLYPLSLWQTERV